MSSIGLSFGKRSSKTFIILDHSVSLGQARRASSPECLVPMPIAVVGRYHVRILYSACRLMGSGRVVAE